jgi:phosphohistidine phosphatase
MKLIILRHAIAVPHGTPGVAEDDRPLTEEGIEKMRKAARGLKAIGPVPDVVLTSPLPRARQTAELAVEPYSKRRPSIEMLPALAPDGNRPEVYRALDLRQELECVMLVGHQPSLGEIAGEIAWGSPQHYVELKKGGACIIDIERTRPTPTGAMIWLLTPSLLRSLAG